DLGAHLGLAAVARSRRLGDRVLHGAEHDLAIDGFFARDCVGDLQKFEFVGAYGRHKSVSLELASRLILFRRCMAMSCLVSMSCLTSSVFLVFSSCLMVICFVRRVLAVVWLARIAIAALAPPQ